MKIKIGDHGITMLNVLKGKMLLNSSRVRIYIINDFTIVEETKKNMFGIEKKHKYITDIKIFTYHPDGKFLGKFNEDGCKDFLTHYDLYIMRQQWCDFEDQLKAFNLIIKEL